MGEPEDRGQPREARPRRAKDVFVIPIRDEIAEPALYVLGAA
jgi:hypothetical protein